MQAEGALLAICDTAGLGRLGSLWERAWHDGELPPLLNMVFMHCVTISSLPGSQKHLHGTHTLTHKVIFGPTSSLGAWHNTAIQLQMFYRGGCLVFLSILTSPALVLNFLQRKGITFMHLQAVPLVTADLQ